MNGRDDALCYLSVTTTVLCGLCSPSRPLTRIYFELAAVRRRDPPSVSCDGTFVSYRQVRPGKTTSHLRRLRVRVSPNPNPTLTLMASL